MYLNEITSKNMLRLLAWVGVRSSETCARQCTSKNTPHTGRGKRLKNGARPSKHRQTYVPKEQRNKETNNKQTGKQTKKLTKQCNANEPTQASKKTKTKYVKKRKTKARQHNTTILANPTIKRSKNKEANEKQTKKPNKQLKQATAREPPSETQLCQSLCKGLVHNFPVEDAWGKKEEQRWRMKGMNRMKRQRMEGKGQEAEEGGREGKTFRS